jgi:hypothetical protein
MACFRKLAHLRGRALCDAFHEQSANFVEEACHVAVTTQFCRIKISVQKTILSGQATGLPVGMTPGCRAYDVMPVLP